MTSRSPRCQSRKRSPMRPTARRASSGCRRREQPLALEGPAVIDTLRLTAEEAAGMIERGEVSGGELHSLYLVAIAERDPELHAYLTTVAEPEGDGVPIALKDVISTRGVETTAGSKILAGYIPVADSTVAARCRRPSAPAPASTGSSQAATPPIRPRSSCPSRLRSRTRKTSRVSRSACRRSSTRPKASSPG